MMSWIAPTLVTLAMMPILLVIAYYLGKSQGRELEPAGERAHEVTQED